MPANRPSVRLSWQSEPPALNGVLLLKEPPLKRSQAAIRSAELMLVG